MKFRILVIGALCLTALALCAQQVPPAGNQLPPGFIDGAKTPELIPDRAAYRLVLLSLAAPDSPNGQDLQRQDSRLQRLRLPDSDRLVLKQQIAVFRAKHFDWNKRLTPIMQEVRGSLPGSLTKARASQLKASGAQLNEEGWSIVESAMQGLAQQLTPDGLSKVDQFIQQAKRHMVVWVGENEVRPERSDKQ